MTQENKRAGTFLNNMLGELELGLLAAGPGTVARSLRSH
jgi:hypothetical protein